MCPGIYQRHDIHNLEASFYIQYLLLGVCSIEKGTRLSKFDSIKLHENINIFPIINLTNIMHHSALWQVLSRFLINSRLDIAFGQSQVYV